MKPQGRLGDKAFCLKDSHWCPVRVHPVIGPAIQGSSDVHVNSRPALRDGDPGIHGICCGPNTWKADGGSSTVIINGRKAFRRGDRTKHCGGTGKLVFGSSNVLVGDNSVSPQVAAMRAAAGRGTPFCEECERKRKAAQEQDEPVPDPPAKMLGETADEATDNKPAPSTDKATLAAQANLEPDDGLNEFRTKARKQVARSFYRQQCPDMSTAEIDDHLAGVDMNQPVQVVAIAPEATLFQRGRPGTPNGQYFTKDPAITPDEVGVSPTCYALKDGVVGPPEVERDHRVVTLGGGEPTPALKTTAAPIDDQWSFGRTGEKKPDRVVSCAGGGAQLMVPKAHQTSSETKFIGGG